MPGNNLYRVARAGVAGACSVYLVVGGLMLLLPGCVVIAMSNNKNFQDEFFEDSNRTQRTIGAVILTVACVLLIAGISLCAYVCATVSRSTQSHGRQGAVINPPPVTQPLVSGNYPPQAPQTYPTGPAQPLQPYPTAGYPPAQPYPSQQPYPAAGGYPPPAAGYPPAGGYPAGPPHGGYPQAGAPQPTAPPPPGGYPATGYQAPPMEHKPGMEQATAPPSYQDVAGPKM